MEGIRDRCRAQLRFFHRADKGEVNRMSCSYQEEANAHSRSHIQFWANHGGLAVMPISRLAAASRETQERLGRLDE